MPALEQLIVSASVVRNADKLPLDMVQHARTKLTQDVAVQQTMKALVLTVEDITRMPKSAFMKLTEGV